MNTGRLTRIFVGVGARMIRQENRYSIIKQKIQRKNVFGKSSQ